MDVHILHGHGRGDAEGPPPERNNAPALSCALVDASSATVSGEVFRCGVKGAFYPVGMHSRVDRVEIKTQMVKVEDILMYSGMSLGLDKLF